MVVTRLYFKIPDTGSSNTNGTSYTIDLAKALSQHHRRLVRQKQIFTVYGGLYQDSNGSNAYISTAPHYWVTKRAINRGFKAWRKQLSDAMSNQAEVDSSNPLRTGKYSDFKIHLDSATNSSTLLAPVDASGTSLPSGEWNYSTVTMPRPDMENNGTFVQFPSDQFDLNIVGPHTSTGSAANGDLNYSRVGLIESWLDSRPIKDNNTDSPKDNPETASDPLTLMFYTGDSDEDAKIVEAINTENDTAPYDNDLLYGVAVSNSTPGANLQMQCAISPDSNSGIATVAGFQALCGLVRIVVTGDTGESGAGLILDVESNGVGF